MRKSKKKSYKKSKKIKRKSLFPSLRLLVTSPKSSTYLRVVIGVAIILSMWFWGGVERRTPPIPSGECPALLYANQCDDNLRQVFINAISQAQESIFLIIYSLTDPRVIQILKEKAAQGIAVTVIHDPKTTQSGFESLGHKIQHSSKKTKGLMHMKILIVDQKKVWIGSANLTKESLMFHDNLVIGLESPALASMIVQRESNHPKDFLVGGQHVEFYFLPEDRQSGLKKLSQMIAEANKTLRVAMFTWTHPDLTDAIIEAKQRGIQVEVVMDYTQSQGVNRETIKKLTRAEIPIKTNRNSDMLHHKFIYIDDTTLVNGSANWTRAAFSKNDDCFMVLHDLTNEQKKKMETLWHAIRATTRFSEVEAENVWEEAA